jgi:signal transduction histidine kinase
MTSFAKHMKGEDAPSYDYVLITKSGERVDVMTTSKLINYNGEKAILGIVTDISELKKAQETLNKTMDELVSVNEKLGVVGSLTRHDVRNKLSAINGYTYLLKKKHENQADIVEGLNKIEQSVKDSVKIFEFAKMYEQLGVEELICVDVGNAVDEALALFSGLTIKIQNDCHGIKMLADSFRRQMFYNFIDNTRKYGVKATTINVYYQEEESGKLSLVYEDDGVGISAENKPRLFAEGFSTGSSTGFGLFLIKKMIDVYGWSIIEEGESGKGAKFSITIPTQQLVHS